MMSRRYPFSILGVTAWAGLVQHLPGVFALVMAPDSLPTSDETHFLSAFRKREPASEAIHNKYFIPAIASIGGLLIVVALCFWWLGWCCNRKKMKNHYTKGTYPTMRNNTTTLANVAPFSPGSKRVSQLSRKPAPSSGGENSVVGTPPATSPTTLPVGHQHASAPFNPASLYSNPNLNPRLEQDPRGGAFASYNNVGAGTSMHPSYGPSAPSATSQPHMQGFQPIPPSTLASNIVASAAAGSTYGQGPNYASPMSVQHLNTSAAAAYANAHRNYLTNAFGVQQQTQRPPPQPLVDQQSAAAAAAAMRMTSFSSASTSTQVADPQTGMYSPHAGNTLSYTSSPAPSSTSGPGVAGIGVPPIPVPAPASQQRPMSGQQVPQESYYTARSVPPPNSRKTTGYAEGGSAGDSEVTLDPYGGVQRGSSGLASAPDQAQGISSSAAEAGPPPVYKEAGKGSGYPQDKKKKKK